MLEGAVLEVERGGILSVLSVFSGLETNLDAGHTRGRLVSGFSVVQIHFLKKVLGTLHFKFKFLI